MTPLVLFLILSAILAVFAFFNWRARFREHAEDKERWAQEALARKQRLGPDFKTGAGKAEPEIELIGPPGNYLAEDININESMAKVDAALERRDKRLLESLTPGASRFGGVPDLPPNVAWPEHDGKKLPFLAQIDLSTLPKSLLPSEGWLYAFGLCDDDHQPIPVRVFHHKCERSELVRATQPKPEEMWKDWMRHDSYSAVPLKTAAEAPKDWEDCEGSLFGTLAEDEGGAAGVADQAECSGDDWITLLGISSAGSMQWSDCGWFHIAIRRCDLEKGDFSKVCAALSLVG